MSFLSTLRLSPILFLAAFGWAGGADRPASALLLDGAVVGSEVIVVGERGAILRSEDNGRSWQFAAGPARATLTGVSFATLTAPRHGWAVASDGRGLSANGQAAFGQAYRPRRPGAAPPPRAGRTG